MMIWGLYYARYVGDKEKIDEGKAYKLTSSNFGGILRDPLAISLSYSQKKPLFCMGSVWA